MENLDEPCLERETSFSPAPKQTRCLDPEKESARAKAGVWAPPKANARERVIHESLRVIQGSACGARSRRYQVCAVWPAKRGSVLGAEKLGGTLGDADERVVGRRMRVVALRGAAERILRGSSKARKAISSRFTEAAAARRV